MLFGGAEKISPISSEIIAIVLVPNSGPMSVKKGMLWCSWVKDVNGHA